MRVFFSLLIQLLPANMSYVCKLLCKSGITADSPHSQTVGLLAYDATRRLLSFIGYKVT